VLGLCLVAGQLAASLLFDVVAPLGPPPAATTAFGVALAFAGVLVASIRWSGQAGSAIRRRLA